MTSSRPFPKPSPRAAAVFSLAGLLGLALLLVAAPGAQAASVTSLHLLSVFSTNPGPSGGGIIPPFTLTGTEGVSLGLNASGVATSHAGLLAPVSAFIDSAVTYQSHSGAINSGEAGPVGVRVNSEVGRLDDVGFLPVDAALNLDYGNNASVTFKIPGGGFAKDVILAEDAGLDSLRIERCATADCSGTPQGPL